MTSIDERRAQLESRRQELLDRMAQVETELDSHEAKDWEEQATEQENDEVLERLGFAARAEIAQIDAALQRVATGDFGICARCGEEIAEKRLDLLPYTPHCANCAR